MLDTDVLVIGGGVAGCMSAIPALEAGLQVVVCEKGKVLDHCGSVGCGVDHYLTVMDSGPEWDTPEFLIKHVPELTDGIVDMAVTSRVIHEMPRVLRRIEALGVNFKDPRLNDYYRLRSLDCLAPTTSILMEPNLRNISAKKCADLREPS